MTGASEAGDGTAPRVSVRVPGLLTRFTGGGRGVSVRAATVAESLDRLLEAHPALRPHLFDARGQLRPHLQLYLDGTEVSQARAGQVALAEGDEVVVLQAVSGG